MATDEEIAEHAASRDHPTATQTLNGFISFQDKTKLDNALGRITYPLILSSVVAANATFTTVGGSYSWDNQSSDLIKDIVLKYFVTVSIKSITVRLVNIDNGSVLATGEPIAVSGMQSLAVILPTVSGRIGLQILKESQGGATATLEAAQLELRTI